MPEFATAAEWTGQLCGLLHGQQNLAVLPSPYKGEITQAPVLMGGHV